jgi:hypothetical protein
MFVEEGNVMLTNLDVRLCVDLSGERVQIPSAMAAGQPPMNLDYHFSELNFDA